MISLTTCLTAFSIFLAKNIDEIPELFVLVVLLEIEIGKRLRVKEGMCRQEKRQEDTVILFIA